MIASIQIALGFLTMLVFFYAMFFMKGNSNQHFILYSLYLFPFMNIDIIPGKYSMSILEISTICFVMAFYSPQKSKSNNWGYPQLLIAIVLISIGVGCYLSEDFTENSIKSIIQTSVLLLYSKIILEEIQTDHLFKEKILKALRMCLIFSFVFLLAQFVGGSSISISKTENINVAGGEVTRYPSFFQDPQKYAQFLSMTGLMMLTPLGSNHTWKKIRQFLPYASMVAILMTGSRAALGGMVAGMSYIHFKKNKTFSFFVIMIVIGILSLTVGSNLPIFKRASLSESYDFRNDIWNDALEIYKIHPIWGIGAGNYSDYVRIHHPDQFWMGENEMTFFDHPESGYLKWLIEYGTIGFLAMLSLIVIPVINNVFTLQKIDGSISTAALISWLIGFYTLFSIGDVRISMMVALITCIIMVENSVSNNGLIK